MARPPDYLPETASQTAGPYVHIGLAPGAAGFRIFGRELGHLIAPAGVPGERIRVEGLVIDGAGAPVRDALLEVWQADARGIYPHPEDPRHEDVAPGFTGWGRVVPDLETGLWSFETIRPGPVPAPGGGMQAPHISVWLVARGLNIGLLTRLYFPEDAAAHAEDPVLAAVEPPARRLTLVAARSGPGAYRFDIRLQGEDETVFLDM
jgi:protocatechuate 3,4-dioxygenase alpha subunit